MGEEVEQSSKSMRSRGTRKLSDVREAPEDEQEEAEAAAEEDAAPVKVSPGELATTGGPASVYGIGSHGSM